ncbi:hypothetical protein Ae201684_016344 [Aphanomyces euteiches]|uniref:Leucine-rich repeat-containing N-terminal plant-type domain-containing protein n=1 Tax=Aphanomyces euteiches TaxID=100861 RepID=A0A6G0WEJ8_9STRA|nr:hypothetical protein Ae201684_016344 [Aphanomyces euteiches]
MMHPMAFIRLLLAAAASASVAQASFILTLCWNSNNVQVPCLNDTIQGNTTFLSVQKYSSSYNFSNLNISFIQALPPSATSIDLSFNQINAISCPIPNSLNFLNVSHNALLNRWIQTPLTVQTLDVSYNQGGLPWIQNLLWGVYLPKLQHLYFRGNNLAQLSLSYDNFPMYPLNALDLNDNPNLVLTIDSSVYSRLGYGNVKLSLISTSYNATLSICGQNPNYVRPVTSSTPYPVASNGSTSQPIELQTVYVCYRGYYDYSYTYSYQRDRDIIKNVLSVLAASIFGLIVVYRLWRIIITKWQERYQLYSRDTICSSTCSEYNDVPTADHAIYIQQQATPQAH